MKIGEYINAAIDALSAPSGKYLLRKYTAPAGVITLDALAEKIVTEMRAEGKAVECHKTKAGYRVTWMPANAAPKLVIVNWDARLGNKSSVFTEEVRDGQ